jgi:hypothetical protein
MILLHNDCCNGILGLIFCSRDNFIEKGNLIKYKNGGYIILPKNKKISQSNEVLLSFCALRIL